MVAGETNVPLPLSPPTRHGQGPAGAGPHQRSSERARRGAGAVADAGAGAVADAGAGAVADVGAAGTRTDTRPRTGMRALGHRPDDPCEHCATVSPAETRPDAEPCAEPRARREPPAVADTQLETPTAHPVSAVHGSQQMAQAQAAAASSTTPPAHDDDREPSPPAGDDSRPLHTARVRPDTRLLHPKPVACPLAWDRNAGEKQSRSWSAAARIAQLEASAERLSTTSSIEHAIRDLHTELKRSDGRRSAQLGRAAMASVDEKTVSRPNPLGRCVSKRTSSIVSMDNAARHGGCSPSAFIMSPNNTPLTSRLPPVSADAPGGPHVSPSSVPSWQATGGSSPTSAWSSKLSLADISESDAVSLTQHVLDEADAAPPPEEPSAYHLHPTQDDDLESKASTLCSSPATQPGHGEHTSSHGPGARRASGIRSDDALEQARDAFVDFDGVHWQSRDEERDSQLAHHETEAAPPTPPSRRVSMARPTSHIDPSTGADMPHYPARVPAVLNLPPRLSSKKPQATTREQRRSRILRAMMEDGTGDMSTSPQRQRQRQSAHGSLGLGASSEDPVRDSWLPDPVAGHRNSFAELPSCRALLDAVEKQTVPAAGGEQPSAAENESVVAHGDAARNHLRRPGRLSRPPTNNRVSVGSVLGNLPSQLRASVFFDPPAVPREVEIKDDSPSAILDRILDASVFAPVNAFMDQVGAGNPGPEAHGKQKKLHRSRLSTATVPALSTEARSDQRSSVMWSGERGSSSRGSQQGKRPLGGVVMASANWDDPEHVKVHDADEGNEGPHDDDDEDEDEEDDLELYQGPPTTLLAELQRRKQQQRQRVRNMGKGLPDGNYATLLEMDTVAEAQRKTRQNKRVQLAWEGTDDHVDGNGSDDEDVPLAIVAAMQRGAKNQADLERPPGLMERREMDDNEPLSHRRARLQGIEPPPPPPPRPTLGQGQGSMLSLSAPRRHAGAPRPRSEVMTTSRGSDLLSSDVEESEEETLGHRRHRPATRDGDLPKTRPVSGDFSSELLGQFADPNPAPESKQQAKGVAKAEKADPTAESKPQAEHVKKREEADADAADGEEETLGQRRRRLRAERGAREREMGVANLAGARPQQVQDDGRRSTLANVLAVHPTRDTAMGVDEKRPRRDSERRAAHDRESKMTASRMQMPAALPQAHLERSGGCLGGAFDDGTAGQGFKTAWSMPAITTYGLLPGDNRASMVSASGHGCGGPGRGAGAAGGAAHHGSNSMSMHDASRVAGRMVPVHGQSKSTDRVEQWRYGVRP